MSRGIDTDDYGTAYGFAQVSGASLAQCSVLGYRSELGGFRWDESESWVLRFEPGAGGEPRVSILGGGVAWLTRVWQSPQATTWACGMDGKVLTGDSPTSLRTWTLDAPLSGVWGFSDESVYAWSETSQRLFHWDGSAWSELACPGRVVVLGGPRADWLVAGGYEGAAWRWDGHQWTDAPIVISGNVTGLSWTHDESVFGCSTHGEVFELTPHGGQVMARWGGPLLDICMSPTEIYLAAGANGMLTMRGGSNSVEQITTDFTPERLSAAGPGWLASADVAVLESSDGQRVDRSVQVDRLVELRRGERPLWL